MGFAWLLGVLGPVGMNGLGYRTMNGGGGVHFRGSPVHYMRAELDTHGALVCASVPYGILICDQDLSLCGLL